MGRKMFAEREFDESQIAGLFKEVKYYITGNISENVQKALAAGEAKKTAYLSGINTHCIVGYDPDMNEVSEATDMLDVPSVDQDWVIASAQAKQILPIKPFSPAEGRLFMGVTACVGDVSAEDQTKLWAMLSWHGGKMTKEMAAGVTHVIVNMPLGELYTAAMAKQGLKIVTSAWVMETVKSNSKMNEELYHPRLLLIPENKPKEKPKPKPKPKAAPAPPAPKPQQSPSVQPQVSGMQVTKSQDASQAQQQRIQQLQQQKQQQQQQQQQHQQQNSATAQPPPTPQQQQSSASQEQPVTVEQKTIIIGQSQSTAPSQPRPGGGA